jgi:hypothetical protein
MERQRNANSAVTNHNGLWLQIMSSQVGGLLQECILQDRLRCAAALEAEGHFPAAVIVMKTRKGVAA